MGKIAFVVGGSRGIGADAVRLFCENGWNTAFMYKQSKAAADTLAKETGALAICGDVSVSAEVDNAFSFLESKLGTVDVLVCCAGISKIAMLQDTSEADFDALFAVNTKGTFLCCKRAMPGMIAKKSGSIVTLSSMWGQCGGSCEVAYSASKAAVIGLTKALAKELGPSGIRVNCVSPGVIDTEMNAHLSPADRAALADETPLSRLGTSMETAKAIYFLASDEASFITGQVLAPNGGIVI